MTPTPPNSPEEALREGTEDFGGDPGRPQEPDQDVAEADEPAGDPADEPLNDQAGDQAGDHEPTPPERVRTGSDRVDDVIRAVEELEERPIEEHVGVFESAQVQLRRALDDPGEPEETVDGAPGHDDHPGHL